MKAKRKKRVAIIGTVGIPAKYGGFETLAEHLVDNLNEVYDFSIYCSGKKYPKEKRMKMYKGTKLIYLPLDANGMQSIFYDTLSIFHALFKSDVLLILGVPGAWVLPFIRKFTNKRIVISIDGVEWKRDKWNILAKWYLFWAEGLTVKYSHIDIADNEAIQDYTASRYGSLSRIIEYGADHTMKVGIEPKDIEELPFLSGDYAFKVCRIEPENNVHVVLRAFSKLPEKRLVMVGNWSNSEYGAGLYEEFQKFPNITLLKPIYDQRKLDVIRGNAKLYIHGHSAGGTNPSLVEAMYLGLPIMTYGVSYNKVTTENRALYFKSEEGLIELVNKTTPNELIELGLTMKGIADRRYVWKLIADKYDFLIQESFKVKRKRDVHSRMSNIDSQRLMDLDLGHLKNTEEIYSKR